MFPFFAYDAKKRCNFFYLTVIATLIVSFLGSSLYIPQANADAPILPMPGVMVHLSPEFAPAQLKGIVIDPKNAFKFDFIIAKGDKPLNREQKKTEYTRLIKYFLASLAVPDEDQWVNLSPYEKNRIIKDDFGQTEMGRDLLAQDYLLKQITASLIYPQDKLGQQFWHIIYERAYKQFGTTNIPVNTFNKVWIVPDEADIFEKGNVAYLYKSHLKVMLEEDYLALQKHNKSMPIPNDSVGDLTKSVIRSIVLPQLAREVNENKNFAPLRQVFSGMILAAWYKRALRGSLLARIYANKGKLKGVDQDPKNNEAVYQQYLKAYKKGVFNYIQEDSFSPQGEGRGGVTIPRKYFSGGATLIPDKAQVSPITGLIDFAALNTSDSPQAIALSAQDMAQNPDDEAAVSLDPAAGAHDRSMSLPVNNDTTGLFNSRINDKKFQRINTGREAIAYQPAIEPTELDVKKRVLGIPSSEIVLLFNDLSLEQISRINSELKFLKEAGDASKSSPRENHRLGNGFLIKIEIDQLDNNIIRQINQLREKSGAITIIIVRDGLEIYDSAMNSNPLLFYVAEGLIVYFGVPAFTEQHSFISNVGESAVIASLMMLMYKFWKGWEKHNLYVKYIKRNIKIVPNRNGQKGCEIYLPRLKNSAFSDQQWDQLNELLIDRLKAWDRENYTIAKSGSQIVIQTRWSKAVIDNMVADLAMINLPPSANDNKLAFDAWLTAMGPTAIGYFLSTMVKSRIQYLRTNNKVTLGDALGIYRSLNGTGFSSKHADYLRGLIIEALEDQKEFSGLRSTLQQAGAIDHLAAIAYSDNVHFKTLTYSVAFDFFSRRFVITLLSNDPNSKEIYHIPVGSDQLIAQNIFERFRPVASRRKTKLVNLKDLINRAKTKMGLSIDKAMAVDKAAVAPQQPPDHPGGIDMNAARLNLNIKRDGNGVPLPVDEQDLERIHLDGLVPVILQIRPANAALILAQ